MFIKVMSKEDLLDGDDNKCHQIFEAVKYDYFTNGAGIKTLAIVTTANEEILLEMGMFGNVYVMNNDGKTINKFSHESKTPHAVFDLG